MQLPSDCFQTPARGPKPAATASPYIRNSETEEMQDLLVQMYWFFDELLQGLATCKKDQGKALQAANA